MLKLGLIREYKQPPDRRVAFTPTQCAEIKQTHPDIDICTESSPDRMFTDDQYINAGIEVTQNLSDCDILFGIKEVPIENLIEGKTYMFFSHTIKKQPHNRELIKTILKKNITLIDYECLVWPNLTRVLGFGRYAGLVGTYETFRAWGKRTGTFTTKPCFECADYKELKTVLFGVEDLIKKGGNKIVVAGGGRVVSGCLEILDLLQIKKVKPVEFLENELEETVYVHLDNDELYARKDGLPWDHDHFFKNHSAYISKFAPYTKVADIMINGVYWEPAMPRHFSKEDTASPDFKLKLIADISCDIEGSVPITLHDTHPKDPVFGWDPVQQAECAPFTENCIDVMAVSNLPSELPADASEGFGGDLLKTVLPALLDPSSEMIKNATICVDGKLTEKFSYLSDYIK